MIFNGLNMGGQGPGLRAPQGAFGLGAGGSPFNASILQMIAPLLMRGQTPLAPPMPPMMPRQPAMTPPAAPALNPTEPLRQQKKRLSEGLY